MCRGAATVGLPYIARNSGEYYFTWRNSGGTQYSLQTTTSAAQAGKWQHIVAVLDPVNSKAKLIVDGVALKTDAVVAETTEPAYTAGQFNYDIGRYFGGSVTALPFNGLIDDVHVYESALP